MRRPHELGLATILVAAQLLLVPATVPAQEPRDAIDPAPAFRGSQDLPDFARAAWAATVLIETRSWQPGSGDRDAHTGSGVVIAHEPLDGSLVIATSGHVVPCNAACVIRVVLPPGGEGERPLTVGARRFWHDPRQDLALLRASLPPEAAPRVASLADGPPAEAGARVLAIGYPDPTLRADDPEPVQTRLFSSGRLLTATSGFEADYRAYASTAIDGHLTPEGALLHTAQLLPGSSGGPLIDGRGAVVGINTGSLVSARGGGCVRAETTGERCLHLAIGLGAILDQLATAPSASSTASTN